MKSKTLFSGAGRDPYYENLRSLENQNVYRQFVDELWAEYEPYADTSFLSRARNHNFQSAYWEMYLGCSLLRERIPVETRKQRKEHLGGGNHGPDFKVGGANGYWLEATTPSAGTDADAVPPSKPGIVRDVPDEKAKLRILHALRDKARQRLEFIQKGLVNESDKYVIAVNLGSIPPLPDLHPPRLARTVFGLGYPEASLDLESGALLDIRYQEKNILYKQSGAAIPSAFRKHRDFEDAGYEGIAAILSSSMTAFNSCQPWFDHNLYRMGDDYCIVHNPLADKQHKLPLGFLPRGEEYWLNCRGDVESMSWKDKQDSS